jgi:hypothetical protein
MKKKLLLGLLGAAGSLGLASSLVSCSDTFNPSTDSEGKLLVSVNLNKDVVSSASNKKSVAESRADAQSVSASDLALKLTSESGTFSREWASAADLSDPVSVAVGKYTLEAYYGSLEDEGFDKPYYYGANDLTIEENRTTPISVTASLANSMVRVELSDMFTTYFAGYKVSLRSEEGNEIEYANSEDTSVETRSVYFKPGEITATIEITKKNGTTATLEPKSFTAEARHSYVLKFDVNGGEADNATLTLTYDDQVDVEDVEIDLSDAILNAPAPTITTDGFTSGDSWTNIEGETSTHSPKVTTVAHAGIDGVVLNTNSATLLAQGWPSEIDLVNGDATAIALMQTLGLKVIGVTKPDKMAMVDFSGVMSHLSYVDGGDNTSTFTLQVRDKNSRIAESPVTFSVTTEKMTFSIEKINTLLVGASTLEFDFATNSASYANLKLQVKNERNTWDNTTVQSITPVADKSGVYHVVATIPATTTAVDLRAILGTRALLFTVERVNYSYSLSAVENGTFGWQAAFDIIVTDNDAASAARKRTTAKRTASRAATVSYDPSNVSFEISTDNGSSWTTVTATKLQANRYLVKGMTAGTSYQVRATCDGAVSTASTFTTEAAGEQLYNSDMEEWYSNKTYSGNYWTCEYPGKDTSTIWGTMNLLTTSDGTSKWSGTGKYAYVAYSGTRQDSSHHGGSSSAIIETVGWGSGSTAIGSSSGCKKVTVGELYLGSYDSTNQVAKYGIAYSSRPSSLEFYYMYTAKNSADYGYAFIKVLDASGNVLAEKSQNLTATDSWNKVTLDISSLYSSSFAAAATLQVGFKSSGNSSATTISDDWLSYPAFGNLSDGRYTGSSLYIDDIKLNF